MWGGHGTGARLPRRRAALVVSVLVALLVLAGRPALAQTGPTDDPGSGLEWHLGVIGAPRAWPVATGKGTTIAIIDTGVDLAHEDLRARISGRATCLDTGGDSLRCTDGGPDDGRDDDGHGTHVAGIAAATGGNGTGVVGVAPDANILAVKVLRTCAGATPCDATGSAADVEAGIKWATDHGATVINLSLGSTTQSLLGSGFADAIGYAWNAGAIPVVASGNSLLLSSGFSTENAIVVNGLNRAGLKASYASNVGSAHWALSAPGGEGDTAASCATMPQGILSTYWTRGTSGYACLAGTSMAAPQVAGAAAILRSAGLSADQTVQRLLATARDIGPPGPDVTYGAGVLDLAAATAGMATSAVGATNPVAEEPTTQPEPASAEPTSTTTTTPVLGVTTSTEPPLVELPTTTAAPSSKQVAAPIPLPDPRDELPPGPVAVAVLMATGIAAASGWVLVRGKGWARRTPGG